MFYPVIMFWAMIFVLAGFQYVRGLLLPDVDASVAASKSPYALTPLVGDALRRYAADLPAALPAAPLPAESAGEPSAAQTANPERVTRLRFLLDAVHARFAAHFADVEVLEVTEDRSKPSIGLRVAIDGTEYRLDLLAAHPGVPRLFESGGLAVTHRPETPLTSSAHRKLLAGLVKVFARALSRYAPELLPGTSPKH